MSNIVLTGFMGTGKSTVGRLVAEHLGFEFVDTDAVIEKRHGPIPTIFADQGEAAFRALEREIAVELAQRHGLVIATGGRMLLDPDNAAALDATGDVFCLTASVDELIARLSGPEHEKRPLLAGDDPAQTIRELLDERAAGYGQFEQIETGGRSAAEVADAIVGRVKPGRSI